ncbi:transporter [Shewanella sp. D64]|uniref:aspartate:alanine exchanger family transporter n=1 Tax=unclassified Shewanella TaxID=196818 RepID=UPI0022BA4646|nr:MULTISPECIES: transporter [unclassified Shewanella]MEC4726203.1 transporter [Shewanella sp. D64]MEC4738215.1 transporter [Shewanella sp. E94]WBJ95358.1 transporter [Shewanella sp. MTB7]
MNTYQLSKISFWVKAQQWRLLLTLLISLFSPHLLAAETVETIAIAETAGLFSFLFSYIADNPFVFLFLSIAIGYPLGKITIKGINLGSTAGTLVVGVSIALTAFSVYGLRIDAPGLVSDIFLMMFMYAIGMKVGPQFFSGLARGGLDFVVIGIIVVFSNFLIVFFGSKLLGLAPGYAAGIISGSYTVTAVMGVAQSAINSGAFKAPAGMTLDQVSANIAAGYAISYVLSSVFIILFIKYLPAMFGIDPVKAGKDAEAEFGSGGDTEALPSTSGFSNLGVLPLDIRAYRVDHQELVGQSVEALFHRYPHAAILKVVRGDKVFDAADHPQLELGDIIGVRGDYHVLIQGGESIVGVEVDEPRARNVDIEVADIHLGKSVYIGQTIEEMSKKIGFGIYLKAMFRQGHQLPILPLTVIEVGDVLRVAGSDWCVNQTAMKLNSNPIVESTLTETFYLALSLLIGYICGHLSVTLGGIPFALGTSAGCMLTGIIFSFLRTRNPAFGGPMSEGARSFLQDIGLSLFVAVLAATVGPKILASFQGIVVIKIAALGLTAALVPPLLGWLYGLYFRKMNPAILAGACAGGRNSTPALKGAQDVCQTDMPAIGYPVPYALTSMIVLVLGYLTMVLY